MDKRLLAARVLDRLGVVNGLLAIRKATHAPVITILSYHRIGDSLGDPYDKGVMDASPADFDRQVGFLAEKFNFIGVDQLCEAMGGGKLPANPVLITFDDGYRACHDVALPILKKHGATAAFFISTNHVSQRRLYWWDRLARAVNLSTRKKVVIEYPERLEVDLSSSGDRQKSLSRLLRIVKATKELDLERYVPACEAAFGQLLHRVEEQKIADELVMTWDQVRALAAAGMDIGSHTRSHRVLQTLPDKDLDDELRGSRLEIEDEIDRPVRSLAYPVGYAILEDRRLVAAVERAGYQVAFSNATGVNIGRRGHRLDLRRLATDYGMPDEMFRAWLAFPGLAA